MGSVIALNEKTVLIPDTPSSRKELRTELRQHANALDVQQHLAAYGAALQNLEQINVKGAHYFLLELDPEARAVKVTGYKPTELERASADYLAVEKSISEHGGRDAVLVSVESIASLRRAYPNYFLDLHNFIGLVNRALH